MMTERQVHGFEFQRQIIAQFGLMPGDNYTSQWDADYRGTPVSIKFIKVGDEIAMGDLFHNASVDRDFYLIVGFWRREGSRREITDTKCLRICGEDWVMLFTHEFDADIREFLKRITNARRDDGDWHIFTADMRQKWAEATPNLVRPRFKRDHKKQKRVQCAISYPDFYEYFVPTYESSIDPTSGTEG
jgi:hypothetical protein